MLGTVKPHIKHIIEVSEKRKETEWSRALNLEFANEFCLMKHINPQIQEVLQTLRRINKKKTIPRNITVKLRKNKDE